eukprot:scaffold7835_cov382-Pinguiococcus_pyrenoidosus.AAC.2
MLVKGWRVAFHREVIVGKIQHKVALSPIRRRTVALASGRDSAWGLIFSRRFWLPGRRWRSARVALRPVILRFLEPEVHCSLHIEVRRAQQPLGCALGDVRHQIYEQALGLEELHPGNRRCQALRSAEKPGH